MIIIIIMKKSQETRVWVKEGGLNVSGKYASGKFQLV